MIYVVATSQVKPESRDAFIKGAKECIAATRMEKGCIAYESHSSINDPNLFVVVESLGDPRRSQCARPGTAYEGLARIFRAAEGVADRDRDHQRRQRREAVSIFA
jgi:hypothetical protein